MDLPFPAEDLARLYRFALLMAGNEATAEQALFEACLGCAERIGGFRHHDSSFACLLEGIRARVRAAPALPAEGASGPARSFASLPEAERAALAMFYTGLLPARQIAHVMKLPLAQLGELLRAARERLAAAGAAPDGVDRVEGVAS